MTSREFIINRLNHLSTIFSNVKFRYEVRKTTGSHIIEVTHSLSEKEAEDYLNAEMRMDMDFGTIYPAEDIVFVTDESLTKIQNAELVIEGNKKGFDISLAKPAIIHGFNAVMYVEENNYALAA